MKGRPQVAVQSGRLNRRIQFQEQSSTQDSTGALQQTWDVVYECWAGIDIQRSQLVYATSEFVEKVTYRIMIRWTRSVVIKPNMRVVYTEAATGIVHTYNIEALVNTQEKNAELILLAYEVDGDQ